MSSPAGRSRVKHRMAALVQAKAACEPTLLVGSTLVLLFLGLTGCGTLGTSRSPNETHEAKLMREVMARKDKIVLLSSVELDCDKPVLVLLHGATEDPTEMIEIFRESRADYNVLLYVYNHHQSIKRVASDFDSEMERLRAKMDRLGKEAPVRHLTFITFSYSAAVFRQAVLLCPNKALFSDVSVIQLVPTAGGSNLARGMENRLIALLVSLASKPSAAENPYGRISAELWGEEGNRRFNQIVPCDRIHTILVEGDPHSLANSPSEESRRRYRNGIGPNVTLLSKSTGAVHGYMPNHPVVLKCLHNLLASSAIASRGNGQVVSTVP